jgi:hypothetical protein
LKRWIIIGMAIATKPIKNVGNKKFIKGKNKHFTQNYRHSNKSISFFKEPWVLFSFSFILLI